MNHPILELACCPEGQNSFDLGVSPAKSKKSLLGALCVSAVRNGI